MLLAGQTARNDMNPRAVTGEFINQRGAMAALEWSDGDVRWQEIGAGAHPSQRLWSRHAGGRLAEGEGLKHKHDHAIMSRFDEKQTTEEMKNISGLFTVVEAGGPALVLARRRTIAVHPLETRDHRHAVIPGAKETPLDIP